MKLYEFFNEDKDNVTNLKTQTKGTKEPLFSKQNIQKAYSEWANGAAVDTDIEIIGKDNEKYVIRQNYDSDSQHFEEGEWYLTDANNNIVNTEGYPDPGELLYDHQADEEFYPKDPNEGMEEGTRCWKGYKKKGTKKMFGKTVPNCVKNEMYNQDDFDNVFGDRKNKKYFEYLDDLRDSGVTNMYGASPFLVQDFNELDEEQAEQILVRWMRSKGQTEDINENSPGDQITLYNVKGEKKIYTIDKVSNNGGMIVSGNGLDRIIVNQTLDAVTFNIKDPNYKIQAPGFQMQGRVVRDISPAVLDNAMMTIRNQIKTAPKNQGIYRDLVADYFALKFKKDKDQIDSMQQENFADGKKKGKSKPGRVKKAGASCNGSVTSLRKRAKNSSGEKSKMYHWCANMKSGKKKK